MSHIYETFSITLIIFFSFKYYLEKNQNLYVYYSIYNINFTTSKASDYYSLIIPLLISYIIKKRFDKNLYINLIYFFNLICVGLYCLISKSIYGIIAINPQTLYGTSGMLGNYFLSENIFTFVNENIKNSF